MLRKIVRGGVAGFVATLVLSLIMLSESHIPRLNPVIVLDTIARGFFTSLNLPVPFAGWMWHVLIGTVWWGAWFAIIEPVIPGRRPVIRGLYFGLAAGLVVIWAILPLVGGGAFGMRLTIWQPVVTLIDHAIYGLVLGFVFGHLRASETSST